MIYLDNAAGSHPKPQVVADAMYKALTDLGASPGRGRHALARHTAQAVEQVREQLCRLIHGPDPSRLVFTAGATMSLNQAVWGLLGRRGGRVVISSMEGTRAVLLELQALVCDSNFNMPRRTSVGVDYNRVNLLMAVLEKRLGIQMGDYDAYVNIAGGIRMNEPAIDLGIVLAIVSSYKDVPIDEKTICFGEVGLSGEVRAVSMAAQRVQEAEKLGFTTCILPEVCKAGLKKNPNINVVGVSNVQDAIRYILSQEK